MPLDAVFLDLGNVLVLHDNALLYRRFAERATVPAAEVERRLPSDFWDRINRGTLQEEGIRRQFEAALGTALTPADFFELWNSHFRIHDEVLPDVEALVGRVKLVLVSNTNGAHMRWVRERLPLLKRFDALVLSYEHGFAKPDAAIFEEALRRAGVPPTRAAFFDDVAEYVEAASRLGLQGRLFTSAQSFRAQLAGLGL